MIRSFFVAVKLSIVDVSCGQVPFIQFPSIGLCQLRKCLSQLDLCFYHLNTALAKTLATQ